MLGENWKVHSLLHCCHIDLTMNSLPPCTLPQNKDSWLGKVMRTSSCWLFSYKQDTSSTWFRLREQREREG